MTGGSGLDTVLEVIAPDGQSLRNDDHNADLPNALDSQLIVASATGGTMTIEARSFVDFGEGPYSLTIEVIG